MARTCAHKQPFDFENAAVGQPGPDGSPIVRTFTTRAGIPGVETQPRPGVGTLTFPLAALRRQPVVRGVIPPTPKPEPARRPARVAQMLALAHRLRAALDSGEHKDQSAAARALGVTRMRVTQLLNLTFLAPDIQERVLFLDAIDGVEPLTERALRAFVRCETWAEQRERVLQPLPSAIPTRLDSGGSFPPTIEADQCSRRPWPNGRRPQMSLDMSIDIEDDALCCRGDVYATSCEEDVDREVGP